MMAAHDRFAVAAGAQALGSGADEAPIRVDPAV
jgi:hypothetical protein